jgi:hypothetical protein
MTSPEAPSPGADDFDPKSHVWDGQTWWTLDFGNWWDGHRWRPRTAMSDLSRVTSRAWSWPLIWIAFIPVVTVSLTLALTVQITHSDACVGVGWMGGDYWCEPGPTALALAPGILNLVPIVGLLSRNPKTRLAALVAAILGAFRLALPLVALLMGASSTPYAPGPRVDIGVSMINPSFPNGLVVLGLSILLWLATFVAIALIAIFHLGDRKGVTGQVTA